MKNSIILIAISAISFAACNNSSKNNAEEKNLKHDSTLVNNSLSTNADSGNKNSNADDHIRELVSEYLTMKNALVADNGKAAASAGNAFVESLGRISKTSFKENKQKIWEDVADDAKEMAEHIGKNANKIEHQREHFDMLSKDMYDMVKAFGAGQTLYQDFCPMYNNNKGASWLSETKEITNPYLGKKMPTCGSIKEEIK